ncbi:MAG: CusA/CzcA family heavy metal efflux RND transporter [Gammaproteobacteria bacterium]|nr:CusA/CzcA family heavy metal efflux RND transporter [Gammaproteobacteria bacterium]
MIPAIVDWSIKNRFLVVIATVGLVLWGVFSAMRTPVDAIPDLSDVQVIIKTSFPGQAPRVIEDQVTYALTTAMLSVPKTTSVRGYSFFGDSYVYVIFEDGTDLYWARSRVLEYLNQVAARLPPGATSAIGPDATGVGWVYEYALVDRTGSHDLEQLRSLQDWFLKYELQSVQGVAEVATVGGMVRQYQVVLDPDRLHAFGLTLEHVKQAIARNNQEASGSVIEIAEAEYMVRSSGYVQSVDHLSRIPISVNTNGTPIQLSDVAEIRIGPQMRRGIAELDGEGEVVGGIVVMRAGENAVATIERVKERIEELKNSLPEGVELVTTYDRSKLIQRAIRTLQTTLLEEFLVVVLVCAIFLYHFRSSLVVMFSLPVAILGAFVVMRLQGLSANIMSLGGIAIAVGAMVDGAIVMIENAHRKLSLESREKNGLTATQRWDVVRDAASEIGAPIFTSLLIITLSFLPVFTLEAQEGRLFAPLAYTKTYAMAFAAVLAITLVPVLIGYLIRGRVREPSENPINNGLIKGYVPILQQILRFPKTTLLIGVLVFLGTSYPILKIGSEFMPPLDEGDLMYMPTTYPGISIDKARELLQQTDKIIRTVPEVENVFGKIGRAETATDPAPLTMIETMIQLKPQSAWREGVTMDSLRDELNTKVDIPGLNNTWVMPIRTRIDMLATGIKTPIGVKIAGPDLDVIQSIGQELEAVLADVPGTESVYSERVHGARYINVNIDRDRAARYGLHVENIQEVVRTAVGGTNISYSVDGLARYPINLRYPQRLRDSVDSLRSLPIVTAQGARIALVDVADIEIADGPPVIKSENARPNGWLYVDIIDRDLGSYVAEARDVVESNVSLPPGYSLTWSGQYEYLIRAQQRLMLIGPLTLLVVILLIYLNFRRIGEVLIVVSTVPFALAGGILLVFLLEYELSVAVGVGFIALAGVAAELGILMLAYLNLQLTQLKQRAIEKGAEITVEDLKVAVVTGATQRIRPIMMTTLTIIVGLMPIMFGTGTGSEVMRRIAAPMFGGMLFAMLMVLLVIPAIYYVWHSFEPSRSGPVEQD